MVICDFCRQFQEDARCRLGLSIPKQMSCREFDPGIERFCNNPADFVGAGQIIQMATYFGIKGVELRRSRSLPRSKKKSVQTYCPPSAWANPSLSSVYNGCDDGHLAATGAAP
jgi:hypothetical protein